MCADTTKATLYNTYLDEDSLQWGFNLLACDQSTLNDGKKCKSMKEAKD